MNRTVARCDGRCADGRRQGTRVRVVLPYREYRCRHVSSGHVTLLNKREGRSVGRQYWSYSGRCG